MCTSSVWEDTIYHINKVRLPVITMHQCVSLYMSSFINEAHHLADMGADNEIRLTLFIVILSGKSAKNLDTV